MRSENDRVSATASGLPVVDALSQGPQPMQQRIELWPIDKLREYPRNPRKNDAAVDRMCASIREYGFKIPVLARGDGEVVDGHLRLKAARKLGILAGHLTTVPGIVLR